MIDVDEKTSDLVRINERMNEMTPKRNKTVYNCLTTVVNVY